MTQVHILDVAGGRGVLGLTVAACLPRCSVTGLQYLMCAVFTYLVLGEP